MGHRDKLLHDDYDSLIVIHRGHGGAGTVLASDGEEVPIKELHALVGGAEFKDKSKIFIIGACRGHRELKDEIEDEDEKEDEKEDVKENQPKNESKNGFESAVGYTEEGRGTNLVTLYGNRFGYKEFQSPEYGGWFSQSLIHALLYNAVYPQKLSSVVQRAEQSLCKMSEGDEVLQYVGDPQIAFCAFYPNIDMGHENILTLHKELVPHVGGDQFNDVKEAMNDKDYSTKPVFYSADGYSNLSNANTCIPRAEGNVPDMAITLRKTTNSSDGFYDCANSLEWCSSSEMDKCGGEEYIYYLTVQVDNRGYPSRLRWWYLGCLTTGHCKWVRNLLVKNI